MSDFDKDENIEKMISLCLKLNRPLSVLDINNENGFQFSYNTMNRKGITLKSLNFNEILYLKNPKKCKGCSNDIVFLKRRNFFCSKNCSAIYNNKKSPKKISKIKTRKCLWCFSEIKASKNLCCNIDCRIKYNYMEYFLKWYNGNLNKTKELESSRIRDFISIISGYKCSICGIFEYQGQKLTLEIEHKDGNSCNNKKDNLCLLCPNCHSQTNTYSGKNRGKGKRSWRKERYKLNKSC